MQNERLFTGSGVTESDRILHTPGQFAKKNLLYVQEAGHLSSLEPHRCVREKLDSFLIMLVLSGKGDLKVGSTEYNLKAGDIAFIDCQEHYEHISDRNDAWKLAWVHFNGFQAKGYYELFIQNNKGSNVITSDNTFMFDNAINRIITLQKEASIRDERICGAELLNILNTLVDKLEASDESLEKEQTEIVNSIRKIINSRFKEQNLIEELEKIYPNFDRIKVLFSERFGISIFDYLMSRRMNSAKELLRFTLKSVEEIAVESGIDDVSVMENMFDKYEGILPEDYRNKWGTWIRDAN